MLRRRPLRHMLPTGLLLLAAACTVCADDFACEGETTTRSSCGAIFSAARGKGSYIPEGACATCPPGVTCSCPPADCLSIVSACRDKETASVNYRIGFGGCKYDRENATARDTRIEWVAIQGVTLRGNDHSYHDTIRSTENTLPATTKCANAAPGARSTCCLQLNVQGNGQVDRFSVACDTRPVIWMGDSTFSSCASDPEAAGGGGGGGGGGPLTFPAYVFGTAESSPGIHCGAPYESANAVCGPYTLPALQCAALRPC